MTKDADAKLVDIACIVRMETPRAWLINDGHREVWIPKSQGELNDNNTVTMPYWLAHEKGLV